MDELERGRSSFAAHDRLDAYNCLSAADRGAPDIVTGVQRDARRVAKHLLGRKEKAPSTAPSLSVTSL